METRVVKHQLSVGLPPSRLTSTKSWLVFLASSKIFSSSQEKVWMLKLDYREVDGEERPILIAFKHGISEEKY